MEERTVSFSRTENTYLVMPEHINGYGRLFGGVLMRWIDEVLAAHGDMPCILVIHGFLLYETRYYDFVERIVAQHPTIKLVVCGHMDGYYTRVFDYDDDMDGVEERHVTAMMLNMQRAEDYAFRILTFDPLTHAVTVNTLRLDGTPAEDIPGRGLISFTIENAY